MSLPWPAGRVGRAALVVTPCLVTAWAIVSCALSRGVREVVYGHDVFLPLDGAWRMLQGQTQHVDFYSPYGPVEPAIVAWMMKLGGVSALAIPRAVAVVGLVSVAGLVCVALSRTSAVVGAWLVAVAALAAVGRNQLGEPFDQVSHSAYYNRIGFALLVAVMVECLVSPARSEGRPRWTLALGGLASGFFTSILAFVKPTFPLVAVVFVAMSFVLVPRSRVRTAALGFGALSGALAGGALIGFHYGAMLGDYWFIASARNGFVLAKSGFLSDMFAHDLTFLTAGRIVQTVANEWWPTLSVVALGGVVPLGAFRVGRRIEVLAVVGCTWAASTLLVLTSWQWGQSPLYAVLALVLLEHALRSGDRDWRRGASMALATACVVSFVVPQVASVAYDRQWQSTYDATKDTFPLHPSARGLVIEGSSSACAANEYARRLEHASRAIAALPDPRVVTLDFSNPFPYLLGEPPPSGGGVCWHYGSTFSKEVYLPAKDMFGDASVVVLPRCPEDPSSAYVLSQLYASVLSRDFTVVQDEGGLIVMRRTAP